MRVSKTLLRNTRIQGQLYFSTAHIAGGTGWRLDIILEPIHKVVESEESVVIPSLAPESWVRGAECGKLNIAVLQTATACATPVIGAAASGRCSNRRYHRPNTVGVGARSTSVRF